jgi:hypothetical protein
MRIPDDGSTTVTPKHGTSIAFEPWISLLNELIGFPLNARSSGKKVLPSSRGWIRLNPERTTKWSLPSKGQAVI